MTNVDRLPSDRRSTLLWGRAVAADADRAGRGPLRVRPPVVGYRSDGNSFPPRRRDVPWRSPAVSNPPQAGEDPPVSEGWPRGGCGLRFTARERACAPARRPPGRSLVRAVMGGMRRTGGRVFGRRVAA
ncbi:hypothetical protein GCM10009753_71610 [Streptantibioticus ferralitis]